MISVIIPCYNGEKYIEDCLNSLSNSSYKDFEIIFVDDNSTDKSIQKVKKFSTVKLIQNVQNLGPSISRNKGAKMAKGDLLFFLDVDTKVETNTLEKASLQFRDNKQMGAAQAQLILDDKELLDSAGHFLSPIGFPYEIGNNQPTSKFTQRRKILGGKSAGLIIRKKIFDQIDGFDEDYFIYGEDTDLCWRVWLAGHQVYYLPSVKVRHYQKSSLSQETNYRVFYQGAKNNISNLIKNLESKKLIWILPIHILAWLVLSLKQIITGKLNMAWSIYRGIWWNLFNIKKILLKRKINKLRRLENNILFGSLKFNSLTQKGWRWFTNV